MNTFPRYTIISNAAIGITNSCIRSNCVTWQRTNHKFPEDDKIMLKHVEVCEERENQQDATIRCLLSNSVSTCFGHHYAHLQDNKGRDIQ